ncbi:hypothetical protein BT63DRAFT_456421 [Microthyrium microscopicum]|uniref:Protein transport protein SEC31 n=1 Tax=Microthyrium microscopicum TaxID=703497 RepID=A0A6A6UA08_9PEZI|nr:hypothetical protein BT63DRAFT_456421 [Microthyrium microscopicum]
MVRLREIPRTAAFAWSTGAASPQLVTGTKAGAVDAEFSNETALELWNLDFENPSAGVESKPAASLPVDSRFHAIAWSTPTDTYKSGIIAGALESGSLDLWDTSKLASNGSNATIARSTKHSGAIKTLQFNPHRDDLLASAGVKGELYITNLTNPSDPFRLGTGAARADDFDALDWNKKVAHILVTGSNGGFATVWDVRNKKESLNLNNSGRKPVSSIAWDPTTPTKLATATSSDQEPAVFVWDLRNSNAPEKTLRLHDQGVLSLSWSQWDPRLLLSCGKDNRTVCWNTHTGEAFGEFPIVTNWTFQTSWNPRHPGLLATASFDGKISIQTIQNTNPDSSDSAADQALDGADFFASAGTRPQGVSFSLPIAPTWLQRPVSATFGFGGKLVKVGPVDATSKTSKISISTFVSDPSIGESSQKFEETIKGGDLKGFCEGKISDAKSDDEKADWTVIETLISGSRLKLKEYIGFAEETQQNGDIVAEKPKAASGDDASFFDNAEGDDNFLSNLAASKGAKTNNPFNVYTGSESDSDKSITRALILGNFEDALDVCLKEKRMSDAFMIAICGGDKCIEKAKAAYFKQVSDGPNYLRLLASFSGKNLWDVVYNADLKEWKDVMAAICTYANEKDFPDLCEALGDRLQDQTTAEHKDASFCYLAGSKLEKVVTIWLQELRDKEKSSIKEGGEESSFFSIHANSLQEFIEKVTIFRQVTDFRDGEASKTEDWKLAPLYAKYAEYADILASQGHLSSAERYLDLLPPRYPAAEVSRNRVKNATRKAAATNQRGGATTTTAQRGQRVVQTFQPAAPANNAYAPTGPSIPQPSAFQQPATFQPAAAPTRNVYAPAGMQQPQQGYQQPGGYQQPYGSAPYGGFGAPPQQPPPTSASPSVPPAFRASDLQQWNDTPDFGPKAIPRRSTPSVQPPTPSPYAPQQVVSPGQANAYGAPPPKSATPLPPPPKAGAPRITSPPNVPLASHEPRPTSAAANSYAPPAGIPAAVQSHITTPRGASPYNAPPAGGPPSNRYAPAPGSQPSAPTGYAGGPPPPRQPAASPYAPPRTSSYGAAPPAPQAYGAAPPPPAGSYGAPPPGAASYGGPPPPVASQNVPPPAPPPKGPAPPPRVNPPPQGPPASRAINTLPSPQPSDSRPGSQNGSKQLPSTPQYPSGDRSHIPQHSQPIFEILNGEMQRIKAKAPAAYQQQVIDTEKRLGILFDHLNNEDLLRPDTIGQMQQLASQLQGRQHAQATQLLTEVMTTKTDEGSNWMVGVKRLIIMSKATPL